IYTYQLIQTAMPPLFSGGKKPVGGFFFEFVRRLGKNPPAGQRTMFAKCIQGIDKPLAVNLQIMTHITSR
ncbi:hypothetical protein VBQ38_12385, partial [Klebsiella pneumoniae]|nr:hypothetical protein [Klebsiella pneumoniae]